MRTQLLCGLGLISLAACSLHDRDGDEGTPTDAGPDIPILDCGRNAHCTPPVDCDPLRPAGQQGCNVGQKCTWIVIQDQPEPIGIIRCVPDGTGGPGDGCAIGPPGETTGFDDCAAGLVCTGGSCHDVCGFGGGADEQCAMGDQCTRVAGLWANGEDDPQFGVCTPGCNPLTQLRGDGTSCGPGNGCYVLVSNTTSLAVCASAGTVAHGQPIAGQAFANSCLPGLQPRRADPDSMTVECGALCAPADVFVTDPADADSGTTPAPKPAALVTNAAAEGGRAPHTCASHGAAPVDAADGESCRYWWAREPFDDLSPFSNTLGWCFPHPRFQFDSNGDMAADAPFPRCAALSRADKVPPFGNPPHDDAAFFWCRSLPAMLKTSIRRVRASIDGGQPMLDRVGAPR